jgi:molybdopterin molybdotransferase
MTGQAANDGQRPTTANGQRPTTNDERRLMSVLPFADARRTVEEHARGLRCSEIEPVELLAAHGRVLAESVVADRDLPPFARATRDGYAVRGADLEKIPARLEVVGEIRAGAAPETIRFTLKPGEAVEIMTGAPVPPGADAVVMVEYTRAENGGPAPVVSEVEGSPPAKSRVAQPTSAVFVEVLRSASPGENIVPAGSEGKAGGCVLARSERLDAARVALAASVGRAHLPVYRRPRVAVLATGDELVDVAAAPGPNQIRNSNTYSLAAQLEAAEAIPMLLPIAPDEPGALRRLIAEGLTADLLLLAGGVSMGRYDLVEQALAGFDAEFFFTGALIQPGKPVVFGRARHVPGARPTYFVGLPGNPISTMVCFDLFARPLLDALSGAAPQPLRYLMARLSADVKVKPGLTRFLPGLLEGALEATTVRLAPWKGSGDVVGTARANCWLVIPPDRDQIPAGEIVSVLPR